MATIGTFKKTGSNEFGGEIVTLSVQAKGVRICQRRSDSRPSWRSKSRPLALGSGGYGEGPDRGPRHIALPGLLRR